jgi:hypothetical protein
LLKKQVLIYLFLAEKVYLAAFFPSFYLVHVIVQVYIVWSEGTQTPRLHTPAYRICGIVMLGYAIVLVLMILARIYTTREDGICILGLKGYA